MSRISERDRGESLFVSELALIERVIRHTCVRSRLRESEAEEFAASARLKLIEHDYAVLRAFKGESRLSTYLAVVLKRHLLDYQAALWGKWRPSAEARRGGVQMVHLERLLMRDGHTLDEAFEVMKTAHGPTLDRREVEAMAARLTARARRHFETDDELDALPADGTAPDAPLDAREQQVVAQGVLRELRTAMSRLTAEDQLLIVMRYEDRRTVAEIAAALKLDQKKLYRRFDSILRQLRSELEAAGVDDRTATAWSALDDDATPDEPVVHAARESGFARPSNREGGNP